MPPSWRESGRLPGALANLTGKEVEEVERQQAQVDRLAERARSLERELAGAREARRQSGLPGPLEQADLAAWRENADELERVEVALAAARSERDVTRSRLAAAAHAMGGGGVDSLALTLPEQSELFEFLRSSQAHEIRTGTVRERLKLLEYVDAPDGGQRGRRHAPGGDRGPAFLAARVRAGQPGGQGARALWPGSCRPSPCSRQAWDWRCSSIRR